MRAVILCSYVFALVSYSALAHATDEMLPPVKINSVRRIFHNGEHNAFTDLCRFKDAIYLTFRSCPDGHGVNPTASILILASQDEGKTWKEVHRFQVAKRDTRDPHLLEFHGKLFVYTGTWYCGESAPKKWELNQHLGYAVWTEDGETWQGPQLLEGTYGHYVWRAASYGKKAYLCGRRKKDFATSDTPEPDNVESVMLESDDGLIWRKAAFFQENAGDETAFLFEDDGTALAVARTGGNRNAQLCRSRPPYQEWTRTTLDRAVGGPLLVSWNGHYLVGGRKTMGGPARTSLSWLVEDKLQEFAELPSGGDNSYPGFVPLDKTRALVSYYSSHEKDAAGKPITAIYLAELEMTSDQ